MSRPLVILNTKANRQTAANWCMNAEDDTVVEFRKRKRTDKQNKAVHGLISQILKQRRVHNGVKMSVALWKAVFMQAWGAEITFVPTLDGDGMFPMGLKTSELNKAECADLITFILAWCAREGVFVRHFDEAA
jgi:hypothetical protein